MTAEFTNINDKSFRFLEKYLPNYIKFSAVQFFCIFRSHIHIIGLISRLGNITNNFPLGCEHAASHKCTHILIMFSLCQRLHMSHLAAGKQQQCFYFGCENFLFVVVDI